MLHNTETGPKYESTSLIHKISHHINKSLLSKNLPVYKKTYKILYLHRAKHKTKTKGPSAKNLAISKGSNASSKTPYVLFETDTDLG